MNSLEKRMVEILRRLRAEHGATAVKASLEAEGILPYELLRTKEITQAAGVGLTVKIGGCEALTDARMARGIGVRGLMAPMIESRFALEKFIAMTAVGFDPDELADIQLLINIETLDGCQNIDRILQAENLERLTGIVLGRTDLSHAMQRTDPDSELMLIKAKEVFIAAQNRSLRCLIGGGITPSSVPFLTSLAGLLDGFEMRKVVFGDFNVDYCGKTSTELQDAIMMALEFEYCWYRLRQQMYTPLLEEDTAKIKKLAKLLGVQN
jgi:hypothetical protein